MEADSHFRPAHERSLNLEKEEILYSWEAPVRPFKKRNREFFTTVLTVAGLVGLILFFIDGIFPLLVIGALVFLVYVFSTIAPENVIHQITNRGIIFGGSRTYWDEVVRFWFTSRFGSELLVFDTTKVMSRVEMVINPEEREKIQKILEDYVPFEEAAPNFMDKAATWLSKRVPLEG